MKNKKTLFGTVLLLFVIIGFCNTINVSAIEDTIYIPPYSYAYSYMGYLEYEDQILINEIDSDGGIDVYIMKSWQFEEFIDTGGLIIYYERMWTNTIYLSGWRIDIIDEDYYYVVLVNDDLFTGRNVYVDISVYWYSDYTPDTRPIVALIISIVVITVLTVSIVLPIVLVKRKKRKKRPIRNENIIGK